MAAPLVVPWTLLGGLSGPVMEYMFPDLEEAWIA